ncbi:ComF family protein [Blautia luti]|uniref:ComF family protein n=1 Tax=Blautia luti DSM 14534 = JCM 17040 TaxID=649762 RepID=A0A844GK58_9FIRM|nr:ComF family protein [Blautia luti]MTD61542.1 ComF family protein [Blautia luti DSM 14534 = JCM 17040]RHQ90524.1 ComF family protein [Ruminococcus sp. AF21-42]BEI59381.1 ComF family protein [Blautia luti]
MKKLIENILNVFYPRCCPVCQKVLKDQNRMICPECEENLHPVGHPRCFLCGKPVNAGEYCRDCEKHHHLFDQGIGIFVYDERMRRSVTRYKYYGCREYGDFYAAAMYRFGRKEILRWDPQLIVPVPIHRTKLRMRGFNQSEYLAERLGRYTGIPVDPDLVQKVRRTPSQKKLTAVQRRKNLESAFRVTRKISEKRILLVDDVYTTGSTMDAMAACLKKKGGEKIYFLTLCTGRT